MGRQDTAVNLAYTLYTIALQPMQYLVPRLAKQHRDAIPFLLR